MNRNYIHIFILIFLFAKIIFAQSEKKIYGYVYDAFSKQPLIGANIILNGTSNGTSSDENGYFYFENLFTGSYSLSVSYVGYQKKNIDNIPVTIDRATEVNFYLTPKSTELDEVVVGASKGEKFSNNVKILSRKEIEKSNLNSVGELLQQIPSIEIIKTGGAGSTQKISIRGSKTNQVAVMLDGVPLNNQFGGSADLSKIPVSVIERVEIYEGGSSSQFGSGAIGGAINIITKKNFENEYKMEFIGGSYKYGSITPSISGNYNNVGYLFSFNYVDSKGDYPYQYLNTHGENSLSNRKNADFNSQNIFARINYDIGNFTFSLNGQNFQTERGLPGPASALTPYARSNAKSRTIGLNTKGTFNNLVVDIGGNYSVEKTENKNLYPNNTAFKQADYFQYHYQYETDITLINTTFYYTYNDFLFITGGYSGKVLHYNDKDLLHAFSPINNATDFSNGFFIHPKLTIPLPEPFNKFSVIPAVRYDEITTTNNNYNRYENQWSPSLSLYLSAGERYKTYLKASISRPFRTPTFSDLFYQDVRVEGKTDLLPEKSLNKEISFGWEINTEGKFDGEITFYNYTIEDMIVWRLGSFEVFRPFNEDAEITGQEYSLKYKLPNNHLEFGVAYTYLQPLNKNHDKTTYNKILPYKPQHSIKSNMRFEYKNFSAMLNYRFASERFVTVANTVELPYYNVFDLLMQQSLGLYGVKTILKFSVTNFTDENYEIIRNYPVVGREFRLGITLTY